MMTTPNEPRAAAPADNIVKFNDKVKQMWNKLTDEDIKLYDSNRPLFFTRLQEKQSVSKEDGEKRLQEIGKYADGKAAPDKGGAEKVA